MAEELQVASSQVPAKIEELVAFVKVGREKLKAVRAEISAFDKMGLENEKRQKVVEQARELSEQLLDAEVSLGEIFATLPIAPGKRTDLEAPEDSDVQMSKKEILQQAGFSVKTAQRYEMLAAHPDIVAAMKADARDKGVAVNRTAILRAIVNENEDYDREHLSLAKIEMDSVVRVLRPLVFSLSGPSDIPLEEQKWEGKVLLIPPRSDIASYINKLWDSFDHISQAIVIVPAAVHENWYIKLMLMASAVYYRPNITVNTMHSEKQIPTKEGFAFVYIGSSPSTFLSHYKKMGGWGHPLNKVINNGYAARKKK